MSAGFQWTARQLDFHSHDNELNNDDDIPTSSTEEEEEEEEEEDEEEQEENEDDDQGESHDECTNVRDTNTNTRYQNNAPIKTKKDIQSQTQGQTRAQAQAQANVEPMNAKYPSKDVQHSAKILLNNHPPNSSTHTQKQIQTQGQTQKEKQKQKQKHQTARISIAQAESASDILHASLTANDRDDTPLYVHVRALTQATRNVEKRLLSLETAISQDKMRQDLISLIRTTVRMNGVVSELRTDYSQSNDTMWQGIEQILQHLHQEQEDRRTMLNKLTELQTQVEQFKRKSTIGSYLTPPASTTSPTSNAFKIEATRYAVSESSNPFQSLEHLEPLEPFQPFETPEASHLSEPSEPSEPSPDHECIRA